MHLRIQLFYRASHGPGRVNDWFSDSTIHITTTPHECLKWAATRLISAAGSG